MRNPRWWRNIGLGFAVSGFAAMGAHFLLPAETVHNTLAGAILALFWPTALLFGGGSAIFNHSKLRAQGALLRGEGIIARWRVDPATWRAFIELNDRLHLATDNPGNELSIRSEVPPEGIEVIVGETAVRIDQSIHLLPRRGTPEITHAALEVGRPLLVYVELRLYYPGGGHGASGVPRAPLRTVLRFPVAAGARHDAERVVAQFGGNPPGVPDFWHGAGDGTDPEDLSKCIACGFEIHQFVSHCPRCGKGMQSRRWARRFGRALVVSGLFISAAMAVVLHYSAPLLLRPGVSMDGTRFSGTAGQGLLFLGILAIVTAFGVMTLLYGLFQIRTGQRDTKVIYSLAGFAALMWLISRWL